MRKHLILTTAMLLMSIVSLFAQEDANVETSGSGIDWFEVLIVTGYLLGVFILLPIVIYTNIKEKIFIPSADNQEKIQPIESLNEEERNNRAAVILERIDEKLTSFQSEEGEDMVTITNSMQAKFMKRGLDYINKKLAPTNADIVARVSEFTAVYKDRVQRAFTGSNWIIACSVGVGILFLLTAGFTFFIVIHFLGLIFYLVASRTTFYGIDIRMKYLGGKGGIGVIGSVMSGLFLGNGVKHYVKESGGSWKRDYETEGQMAIIGLVIMLIIAIILGFFTALLGVINFVLNYATSFILPFMTDDKWYAKNFDQVSD